MFVLAPPAQPRQPDKAYPAKNYKDAYCYLAGQIHKAMQSKQPVAVDQLYVYLFEADKLADGAWEQEAPEIRIIK